MVFRKDTRVDTFQRQISALRQQLGSDGGAEGERLPASPDEPARGLDDFAAALRDSRPTPAYAEPTFQPIEAPPAFSLPAAEQTSVIAHDTAWNGDLQTEGSIHLHGKFEGSVSAHQDVFVAEEADVAATIAAENVAVAGLVRGTIRCRGRFEVLPQGRVAGDVFAPVLVVHEGATINGQFQMTAADAAANPTPTAVRRRTARAGS